VPMLGFAKTLPSLPLAGVCLPVELEGLKDLQFEVDVARHLGLAAIAYIYSVLPCLSLIAPCSLHIAPEA
jgi:hypothetical protein